MVERIGDDGVFLGEERFEHTAVGIEACGIENGVLGMEIVGDGGLQLFVDVLRAADESHRRHAEATLLHHVGSALYQTGMIGEAQIVVGTEVEHFLAFHHDTCPLRTFNDTFLLVEACLTDLCQLLAEMLFHFTIHTFIRF